MRGQYSFRPTLIVEIRFMKKCGGWSWEANTDSIHWWFRFGSWKRLAVETVITDYAVPCLRWLFNCHRNSYLLPRIHAKLFMGRAVVDEGGVWGEMALLVGRLGSKSCSQAFLIKFYFRICPFTSSPNIFSSITHMSFNFKILHNCTLLINYLQAKRRLDHGVCM